MPLDNEIAVMFWAGRDPRETLSELLGMGFHCGQLGVPGSLDVSCAPAWLGALEEAGFRVYTVFAAFEGESYADIPTVERSVGLIPQDTRAARVERMLQVSDFAAALHVGSIATHIGFVPEDKSDPDYPAMIQIVRQICDHAAQNRQTFALETGQEPAQVLLEFIHDVNRDNLGINFDPANLILYGAGDPIEALQILWPHVLSVHAKDGDWPAKDLPGALGEEQPLGKGAVGIPRFLQALRETGYTGPLALEREASDPARRLRDLNTGAALLRSL